MTFLFIDLIIRTSTPSWKKYATSSLSHSFDTDNRLRSPNHREKPVGGSSLHPVCVDTYFYHHLALPPDQPCHYGAFPAYRGQLSHREISPGARLEHAVILPSPPRLLQQHHSPHQHLLIRQTRHSHLRLGERNPACILGSDKANQQPQLPSCTHTQTHDSLRLSAGHMQSTHTFHSGDRRLQLLHSFDYRVE